MQSNTPAVVIDKAQRRVTVVDRRLSTGEWTPLYRLAQAEGVSDTRINEVQCTIDVVMRQAGIASGIDTIDEATLAVLAEQGWQIERGAG